MSDILFETVLDCRINCKRNEFYWKLIKNIDGNRKK